MAPAEAPSSEIANWLEKLAGKRAVAFRRAVGGYTPAERWVVTFADGASAFIKYGPDTATSPVGEWLRREIEAYATISGSFMPKVLGWDDDGETPLLVLEDLSGAAWPPPWTRAGIEVVFETLAELSSIKAPAWAPDLSEHIIGPAYATPGGGAGLSGWEQVAQDPGPFLSLRLCTDQWLERCLDDLVAASGAADASGDALVHVDIRSDNLCFAPLPGDMQQVKIVDWNWVSRGAPDFDQLAWLPSLHSEGGPPPWELRPETNGVAAVLAGFFAVRAGLPIIPTGPRVRVVQLAQLRSALPWAVHELGLPPLDGELAPVVP